jgi:hypothetical protein
MARAVEGSHAGRHNHRRRKGFPPPLLPHRCSAVGGLDNKVRCHIASLWIPPEASKGHLMDDSSCHPERSKAIRASRIGLRSRRTPYPPKPRLPSKEFPHHRRRVSPRSMISNRGCQRSKATPIKVVRTLLSVAFDVDPDFDRTPIKRGCPISRVLCEKWEPRTPAARFLTLTPSTSSIEQWSIIQKILGWQAAKTGQAPLAVVAEFALRRSAEWRENCRIWQNRISIGRLLRVFVAAKEFLTHSSSHCDKYR